MTTKHKNTFLMNVFNGAGLGIVIALGPTALFSELLKALVPHFPALAVGLQVITMASSLAGIAVGAAIANAFHFTTIEMVTVGIVSMISGRAIQVQDKLYVLKGTGDIITMCIASALAVAFILAIRKPTKQYAILVIPSLTIVFIGTLGYLINPYVTMLTTWIGQGVAYALTLQPLLLAIIIAVVFAVLIATPISVVGIALAIQLAGMGSGAANLGVVACCWALTIACRRSNPLGIVLTHIIGAPKMSMNNVLTKPKLFIPIIIEAIVLGTLAAIFNIQGTPLSAGFGVSGLVGPINHLNIVGWSFGTIVVLLFLYIIIPVSLSFALDYLFVDVLKWIDAEDYRIELI